MLFMFVTKISCFLVIHITLMMISFVPVVSEWLKAENCPFFLCTLIFQRIFFLCKIKHPHITGDFMCPFFLYFRGISNIEIVFGKFILVLLISMFCSTKSMFCSTNWLKSWISLQ